MTDENPQTSPRPKRIQRLTVAGGAIAIFSYEILVIVLLYKELSASSLRATNNVLVLLGLLFLPAVLVAVARVVKHSNLVFIKAGNLEARFAETDKKIEKKTQQLEQQFEEQLAGQLSTAEQTLYPIIGGPNVFAKNRLNRGRLVVGSKDFAANIVVAELMAQHVESYGIECERRIPNGGTIMNYACIINGWIDLLVDYTGTGCLFLNIDHRHKKREEILHILNDISLQRFQFEWLQPLGTMTNYCIVMKKDVAAEKKIKRISDLSVRERGKLRFCGNSEFMNRRDGFPGLKEFYNLRFSNENLCSMKDRYNVLVDGEADLSIGHTTDPDIRNLDLIILTDSKEEDQDLEDIKEEDQERFFPDYYEVPIARTEALQVVDGLRKALLDLANLGVKNEDITALIQDYRDSPQSLGERVKSLLARKKRLLRK